mmetsp:Transcript_9381/g.29150  ORF Transcript_9381/g.29150 Transcript_9381/m.29150 type:complete len:211 (-) Transcript_9381:446-1078(-)
MCSRNILSSPLSLSTRCCTPRMPWGETRTHVSRAWGRARMAWRNAPVRYFHPVLLGGGSKSTKASRGTSISTVPVDPLAEKRARWRPTLRRMYCAATADSSKSWTTSRNAADAASRVHAGAAAAKASLRSSWNRSSSSPASSAHRSHAVKAPGSSNVSLTISSRWAYDKLTSQSPKMRRQSTNPPPSSESARASWSAPSTNSLSCSSRAS